MLFGGHDEVVGLVLVVDNVFQGNAQLVVERVKEVLLVDEGHAADFFHDGLGGRVVVHEVGRDGNGQFAAKFLSRKTWKEKKILSFYFSFNFTRSETTRSKRASSYSCSSCYYALLFCYIQFFVKEALQVIEIYELFLSISCGKIDFLSGQNWRDLLT